MKNVTNLGVEELIDLALKELSSDKKKPLSLRKLSDLVGISHQTLSNWRKGSPEDDLKRQFIENIRKMLKLNEKQAYNKAIKKK